MIDTLQAKGPGGNLITLDDEVISEITMSNPPFNRIEEYFREGAINAFSDKAG